MKREHTNISSLTPLQYIEAIIGEQWIDTLFTPNNNTRVVCEFMVTKYPSSIAGGAADFNNGAIPQFGARYIWNDRMFGCSVPANYYYESYFSLYGNKNKSYYDYSILNNTFLVDGNKNVWKIYKNGTLSYNYTYSNQTFTCPFSMYLFSIHSHNSGWGGTDTIIVKNDGQLRMFSCDIYDNGTQIRQFRPYLNAGEAGMLDELNNVWYGNNGTGEFLYA